MTVLLGIGLGVVAAASAWAWCARRRSALLSEDERMLADARAGQDVSSWARSVEEQVSICRVSPDTVRAAAGLGLVGEETVSAASSPSYEGTYEMRRYGIPYAVLWAPLFACALALAEWAGVAPLALASCALMLVVAAGDWVHHSIALLPCVAAGVLGGLAWGATPIACAGFALVALGIAFLLDGRVGSSQTMGTGDALLFVAAAFGTFGTGNMLLLFVTLASLLLAALISQRMGGQARPLAMGPLFALPYLVSWVVTFL